MSRNAHRQILDLNNDPRAKKRTMSLTGKKMMTMSTTTRTTDRENLTAAATVQNRVAAPDVLGRSLAVDEAVEGRQAARAT